MSESHDQLARSVDALLARLRQEKDLTTIRNIVRELDEKMQVLFEQVRVMSEEVERIFQKRLSELEGPKDEKVGDEKGGGKGRQRLP